MLQQILQDMYIDPDLLAELDEEQKQILFCKIRQEQVRRWKETEEAIEAGEKKEKHSLEVRKSKIRFLEGSDGQPWVWVMGDHVFDKSIEQVLIEEAQETAKKQAEEETYLLREIENLSTVDKTVHQTDVEITENAVVSTVQMRPDRTAHVREDIDVSKEKRSSEIFQSLEISRQKCMEEAEKEVKHLFVVWQEQERKAKEAEKTKRLLAKRVREDNAKSMRKLKTESQIIGVLSAHRDIAFGLHKPVPGGTTCPRGRPARPADGDAIMSWYKEVEEPKGIGINPKTHESLEYFYGLISRQKAEEYLVSATAGTFLVRISDRVWGYALSYRADDSCKHYLIDASDGRYRFFGSNQIFHVSLDDLIEYHKNYPFSIVGHEVLRCPLVLNESCRATSIQSSDIEISHL